MFGGYRQQFLVIEFDTKIKPARIAEETIIRTDRRRASYYSYYTGKKWGAMENYDFALNTSRVGIENAVKLDG